MDGDKGVLAGLYCGNQCQGIQEGLLPIIFHDQLYNSNNDSLNGKIKNKIK